MMTKEEAMNLVKQVLPCLNIDKKIREAFETLIPELCESEDERIIRLLRELGSLDAAKELYEEFNLSYTDILYWLEKQKEQKPLTTEETELNSIAFLEQMGYTCIPPRKEQKPAEWSEEDEATIGTLINYFEGDALDCSTDEMIRRIRALRPSWKPSEEQMGALSEAVSAFDGYEESDAIKSLYNDLKKLM